MGIVKSRQRAVSLIMSGNVYITNEKIDKPGKLIKNKHYNFLETLAEDVFDELFKDKRIDKISLQIEKLEIMKDCASVGIPVSYTHLTLPTILLV